MCSEYGLYRPERVLLLSHGISLEKEATTSVSCSLHCCYCSASKSCPTLCDPKDCSMPGFPVLHCLLEFAQTYVHWVGDAIQPSHFLLPPLLLLPSTFSSIRSFPMSQLFATGGQNIGVSTSASVLSMNIQGWFPLGFTGLISLLSKGLSRVVSSTTTRKHLFLSAQSFSMVQLFTVRWPYYPVGYRQLLSFTFPYFPFFL